MTKKTKIDKTAREVAIIDFETDPFKYDRVPEPFACGVLWRGIYVQFWGPDCWRHAADYLNTIKTPLVIYAHNGGKFDFFFMYPVLDNPIKLINSRIVSARMGEIHELRDSWAIMPFSLATYKKTEIDYAKFEPEVRDLHRTEITYYLFDDCNDLMAMCTVFVGRFGFQLTIAGTAMGQLKEIQPQEFCTESHDEKFRRFYFGGRVECFDSGVLRGAFRVYDVNSMYPAVMSQCDHPIGNKYVRPEKLSLDADGWFDGYPRCMYFATVEGYNLGALPAREVGGFKGLTFAEGHGVFETTSHELRAALSIGKFKVTRILDAYVPCYVQTFDEFVTKFSDEKKAFKKAGDRINELLVKYVLNSAYGKFGQNPDDFKEYHIEVRGVTFPPVDKPKTPEHKKWVLEKSAAKWCIWSKPSPQKRYFDVAIAASVTSAARAVLMLGIANAKRPIYCDTDSIICEELRGVEIDEYNLGAWKLEAIGDKCAIAGKKLYALFKDGMAVKWASKGTKLKPEQIELVAEGGEVMWESDAPNFSLTGNVKFVARKSRKTA